MHDITELLKFFREFLRSPRMIGSIIPTSRHVVDNIAGQIAWENANIIVEYGPGLGTFTRPLLERLPPTARLIAIDVNPRFVAHLRQNIRDPRLIAVEGSATDVEAIVEQYGGGKKADYIVSGLPFSTLPPGAAEHIVGATETILSRQGALLIYQYSCFVVPFLRAKFPVVTKARMWRNIPPCFTISARKSR